MKLRTLIMFSFASIGTAFVISAARADDDTKLNIVVGFGRGLNTSGALNDAVIPDEIKLKKGGLVQFHVAGTHQIFIYKPGKVEIDDDNTNATYINDLADLYYQGILPTAGGNPVTTNPSNARNRIETVYFSDPGTYLVICNLRTHFDNGMVALLKVQKR